MTKEDEKTEAKTIYEEIQGGARKLIIKNKKGEIKFQTNLTVGVGGVTLATAMAPVISAIGMFAMFINDYQIIVEREVTDEDEYSVDAEVIDIEDEEDEASESTSGPEGKDEKTVGKKKGKK